MMRKRKTKENEMKLLYYSPNKLGSLSGVREFHNSLKKKSRHYKLQEVLKWLQSQEAYTLHKSVIRKFKRRTTIVSGLNDQIQCDLIDMRKFKKENKNFTFILSVIDVFSKYAWTRPLKSKTGVEVAQKLGEIISQRSFRSIQFDKGKEFYNVHVRNLLSKNKIHYFSTENDDIKAACVERFNRTLQTKLYRWFTKTNSSRWIEVIDDIVDTYNNTFHSSIKMAPIDVNHGNEEDVWLSLYSASSSSPPTKPKLKLNDVVRISKYKHVFSKGYDINWSHETFIIDEVVSSNPVTYRLRDQLNEKIHGAYYQNELQKVHPSTKFLVESILDQRKKGKTTQYLVKFKGYPSKFNEWINKSNFN